ncbi:hypothetical protein SAMN04487910_3495 [Aquimarina amphilecti]|uniref:Ig-like domain-containing protein n=1 Tax=Aquimarina amphilecti TaxID=1038014 RepID=A0A1H7TLA2_AQUAM|nr:hypothetical protein [Aquimarina amphilecti]SEL85662.1 hypothetical protein SAMN04487910_3495 [Aquimarina amphilecti]
MKNLKILSLLMLGLMLVFTACEESDDSDSTTDCPELSFERDGGKLIANFEEINSLDVYEWFVNDELVETENLENQRDNTLDISEYNPGTYTICIKAETPDCPAGVEFCKEIVVGEDMEGCPELKFTRDGDYLIADFEGLDTLEFYAWQVSGETLGNETIIENEGTDNQGDNKFSLANLEEGTYTICLISESPTCTSAEYCEEITIDGDGQDSCPDLSVSSEGNIIVATISGTDDFDLFKWYVNNQLLAAEDLQVQGNTVTLDLSNYNPGSYEVCVKFNSNDCSQGIEACVSAQVTDDNNGGDDCPDLSFIEEGTLMFANFPGINQLDVYEWFVDGVLVETESLQSQDRDNKLDLSSYNPGTYTVCIKAETNECPNGTEFCRDVVIPEPQPVDCSVFKLEYIATNGAEFVNANGVILFGLEDNSVVWEIDGTQINPTTTTGHFIILKNHLSQAGKYEICYKAESTECGALQECIEVDFQGL